MLSLAITLFQLRYCSKKEKVKPKISPRVLPQVGIRVRSIKVNDYQSNTEFHHSNY